jgi:hypothetical protein
MSLGTYVKSELMKKGNCLLAESRRVEQLKEREKEYEKLSLHLH